MLESTSYYLSIDDAALRLGISSIRLRQWVREKRVDAVLDNHGRWRVRLPADPRAAQLPAPPTDAAGAVELLIDEIMELRLALAENKASLERLAILAERQQHALERAVGRAETERAARTAAEAKAKTLADQAGLALALADAAVALVEMARGAGTGAAAQRQTGKPAE